MDKNKTLIQLYTSIEKGTEEDVLRNIEQSKNILNSLICNMSSLAVNNMDKMATLTPLPTARSRASSIILNNIHASEIPDKERDVGNGKLGVLNTNKLNATLQNPGSPLESWDKKELLLVMLLEQVCKNHNPDPSFFKNACKRLHTFGYISSVHFLDDLTILRKGGQDFLKVFEHWSKGAKEKLQSEFSRPMRRSESDGSLLSLGHTKNNFQDFNNFGGGQMIVHPTRSVPFIDISHYSVSRYSRDFEQISKLGKGGFGSVYRARHRVDGSDYAVKKVKFTFRNADDLRCTFTKIIREAKTLSVLDHSNVIRYHQAWFEPSSYDENKSEEDEDEFDQSASRNVAKKGRNKKERNSPNEVPRKKKKLDQSFYSDDNDEDENGGEYSDYFGTESTNSDTDCANYNELYYKPMNDLPNEIMFESVGDSEFTFDGDSSDESDSESDTPNYKKRYEHAVPAIELPESPESPEMLHLTNNMKNSNADDMFTSDHQHAEDQILNLKHILEELFNQKSKNFEVNLYIQMQLCKNETLETWLWSQERAKHIKAELPGRIRQENLRIFKQIVEGLHHIHSKGMIHRDLKPSNIFISNDNIYKIGDFGLAKYLDDSAQISPTGGMHNLFYHRGSQYGDSVGVGTPTYAAPEQLTQSKYSNKADIFSLGILLFELFHVFSTHSERAQLLTSLRRDGQIPNRFLDFYPDVVKLVQAMTSHDPNLRPSAAQILKSEIFLNLDTQENSHIAVLQKKLEEKDYLLREQEQTIELLRQQIMLLQHSTTSANSNLDMSSTLNINSTSPPMYPLPKHTQKIA